MKYQQLREFVQNSDKKNQNGDPYGNNDEQQDIRGISPILISDRPRSHWKLYISQYIPLVAG